MSATIRRVHTLHVLPSLPEGLEQLREIALDLHWTWNFDAIDLFRRLDHILWREVGHNPMRLLAEISQERLQEAAEDEGFLSHLERVRRDFQSYREERTWYQATFNNHENLKVIYLSAEFGLHECLPVYSGGLGLLAGDHLKAASDLGVPMVGMGLFYQHGYFHQYLNADGWQQELYPEVEIPSEPMVLVRGEDGTPLEISVQVGPREVKLHIWKVIVGRVDLYLLDTNVLSNHPEDRGITDTLYGGDTEKRIQQEIVLGIGGYRALQALGIEGSIFHMNEGHSAFIALERIRQLMAEHNLTFEEAREATRAGHVFTTHTPVPAGIDRFGLELMDRYFQEFWPTLGLGRDQFLALGGANAKKEDSSFNMATLAIGLSAFTNGVSKLHGMVSRKMWRELWPDLPEDEVPIRSVTNGIHARSWISPEMSLLLERYLGPNWQENPLDRQMWRGVREISTEELWRTRVRLRERLITFARHRLRWQLTRRGESITDVELGGEVLDMNTLTIGFARRFATYKRASLLFADKDRLIRLLTDPDRPIQLILAGKAHPKDDPGKNIIREIIHFARDERLRNRIVFLEDYDINVARYMVQGCDLWLNTPRRPYEASGTSGMKAAVNGVLHCSTLDGWWSEAYDREIGWAIGGGEEYEDFDYQDRVESETQYDLLEEEIVPLFYTRDRARVAREWTEMIKRMLEKVCPVFFTTRMVSEYAQEAYIPNHERVETLREEDFKRAKNLTAWKKRIRKAWGEIKVLEVKTHGEFELRVGDRVPVEATVQLGSLKPEDVQVEVFLGRMAGDRELKAGKGLRMELAGQKDGTATYKAEIVCEESGHQGFALRVLPQHEDLTNPLDLGLVTWE